MPTWGPTYGYLRAQIEPLAGAVRDPLSPRHVASFLLSNGAALSWLAVLLAVAVGLASLPRFVGWLRQHIDWPSRIETLGVAVFVGSWFLIPLFVATANVNQTARYALAGYPALAIIGGGLIAGLRPTVVRYTAFTLAVLILLTQTLQANVPGYATPLLPAFVYFTTPAGAVTITFRGPDGLAGLPVATNYTLTIERYLESVSSEPGHRHRQLTVAILENQADANVNDLGYYARVRDDPFKFKVLYAAASPAALIAELRAYDVRPLRSAGGARKPLRGRPGGGAQSGVGSPADDAGGLPPLPARPGAALCRAERRPEPLPRSAAASLSDAQTSSSGRPANCFLSKDMMFRT